LRLLRDGTTLFWPSGCSILLHERTDSTAAALPAWLRGPHPGPNLPQQSMPRGRSKAALTRPPSPICRVSASPKARIQRAILDREIVIGMRQSDVLAALPALGDAPKPGQSGNNTGQRIWHPNGACGILTEPPANHWTKQWILKRDYRTRYLLLR